MSSRSRLHVLMLTLVTAISHDTLSARDTAKPHPVTPKDAEQLAYEVFRAWGARKLPKFGLDISPKSICMGFYTIEATWENPKPGSGVVGHVIVDMRTGDVWDPFTCKQFLYTGLTQLQRRIRNRIGLSNAEYRRLKRRPPC